MAKMHPLFVVLSASVIEEIEDEAQFDGIDFLVHIEVEGQDSHLDKDGDVVLGEGEAPVEFEGVHDT